MSTVVLRPAEHGDVPVLAALDAELFGADAWPRALVSAAVSESSRWCVVAVDASAVIGYAAVSYSPDVADLERIAMHPSYRRRSGGRQLLRAVLGHARSHGVERLLLEVSAANHTAVAFYAAAGFHELSRRRRYYADGSDALVLGLELSSRPGRLTG